MSSAELSPPVDRWYRARSTALANLLRAMRHEMATPLSGALLHVEVLRRTLRKESVETPDRDSSLRAVEEGLSKAAELLEEIGDRVAGKPEPSLFSGMEIVRRGSRRHEDRGIARGVPFAFSGPETAGTLFGCAGELEEAVADITAFALDHASPGTPVTWEISSSSGEVAMSCRFDSSLAPERLDGVLGSWRLAGSDDLEPARGLLFADWAIEAQGGRLTLVRQGDTIEARAVFAAVEER